MPFAVSRLPPPSFGFVMATGIVAVAAYQQGWPHLASLAFDLALLAWVLLGLQACWRLAQHPREVLADLRNHQRAPAFFTAVAGTGVLAGGCMVLDLGVIAAAAVGAAAGRAAALRAGLHHPVLGHRHVVAAAAGRAHALALCGAARSRASRCLRLERRVPAGDVFGGEHPTRACGGTAVPAAAGRLLLLARAARLAGDGCRQGQPTAPIRQCGPTLSAAPSRQHGPMPDRQLYLDCDGVL